MKFFDSRLIRLQVKIVGLAFLTAIALMAMSFLTPTLAPWLPSISQAQEPAPGIDINLVDERTRSRVSGCLEQHLDAAIADYQENFTHYNRDPQAWERANGDWERYESDQRTSIFKDVQDIEERLFDLSQARPRGDLEYYASIRRVLDVLHDYLKGESVELSR